MKKAKELPIIFTNEHVDAIIEGRKTQTRRVIKTKDGMFSSGCYSFCLPSLIGVEKMHEKANEFALNSLMALCPYGKPGDKLWVREKFVTETGWPKPAIHMPRSKSRLSLLVKKVRVEKLCSITGKDCIAEGVSPEEPIGVFGKYRQIWNEINKGKNSFDQNPWVWVVDFDPIW